MSIVACSVDFIPVRVVDKSTGWLNKSALKVVQVSVKGAGTDEDTWYEDNKGQVGCIHFDILFDENSEEVFDALNTYTVLVQKCYWRTCSQRQGCTQHDGLCSAKLVMSSIR